MTCPPHQILIYQIEINEMGGVCSMYGGEERYIRGFGGETQTKETIWNTQAWMGR
jgi:hypothetical protein